MKPISWGDKILRSHRLQSHKVCVCVGDGGDEKACVIVNGLIFSFCGKAFCKEINCFILQPLFPPLPSSSLI